MEQLTTPIVDYQNLTSDNKDKLIGLGLDIMRTLCDVTGPIASEQIWNQLSDSIHPDLKHDILMQLLKGNQGSEVIIADPGPQFINVIKIIRTYTRLGLREAKELADNSRLRPTSIRLDSWRDRESCLRELRLNGSNAY